MTLWSSDLQWCSINSTVYTCIIVSYDDEYDGDVNDDTDGTDDDLMVMMMMMMMMI
jgi:hypothetical protein